MQDISKNNDEEKTNVLISRGHRRKLGMLINGNETLKDKLEEFIDEKFDKKK